MIMGPMGRITVPVSPRELPSAYPSPDVSAPRQAQPDSPSSVPGPGTATPTRCTQQGWTSRPIPTRGMWEQGLMAIWGGRCAVLHISPAPIIPAHPWAAQHPCMSLGCSGIPLHPRGTQHHSIPVALTIPACLRGAQASSCIPRAPSIPGVLRHPSASPGHPGSLHPQGIEHPWGAQAPSHISRACSVLLHPQGIEHP